MDDKQISHGTMFHVFAALMDGWMGRYVMGKLREGHRERGDDFKFTRITGYLRPIDLLDLRGLTYAPEFVMADYEVVMIFDRYELVDFKCGMID